MTRGQSGNVTDMLCTLYIYIYMSMRMCIYAYIYRERKTDTETEQWGPGSYPITQ